MLSLSLFRRGEEKKQVSSCTSQRGYDRTALALCVLPFQEIHAIVDYDSANPDFATPRYGLLRNLILYVLANSGIES